MAGSTANHNDSGDRPRVAIHFEVTQGDLLRGKCVIAARHRRRRRPIFTRCRSNLRRHAPLSSSPPSLPPSLPIRLWCVVPPRFFVAPDLARRCPAAAGASSSCDLLARQMNGARLLCQPIQLINACREGQQKHLGPRYARG